MDAIKDAWNKTRGDNPEWDSPALDPDFRGKLQMAVDSLREGNSSGIAGLKAFEKEVKKNLDKEKESGASLSTDPSAKPTPKGSGAQDSEEKALRDAAAAASRVEASGVNSPKGATAARPLAAESPANTEGLASEGSKSSKSKRSKAAKKSSTGSKKAAAKKAGE